MHTFSQSKVTLSEGFWKKRQNINRTTSLSHGWAMLEKFGNFHDLKLAVGLIQGNYQGPLYIDSDLYKWLEAASLELGNSSDPALEAMVNEVIGLLEKAQCADGYLNSYYQVVEPENRWKDLASGHELYCAGHLFQAAAAHMRATGDVRLLKLATRFADCIDRAFGPGKIESTCGHPEIEMALVELFRASGEERYLRLAEFFIDQRGYGRLISKWPMNDAARRQVQDHVPVREAQSVVGHAVRQLYLLSGMADVWLHTGEEALMEAQERLWEDVTCRKMYVTGGVGSQPKTESFGPAYDLPAEHGYCETCAGIALVMWNWRLLVSTGEARFAEVMERVLFNAFLSGFSLDGKRYFYENPLFSRAGTQRGEWHACACCPPNVTRVLASIQQMAATHNEAGVQVHQLMACVVDAPQGRLRVETEYPWKGRVQMVVESVTQEEWEIAIRVPSWACGARIEVNGESAGPAEAGGYAKVKHKWREGDAVTLEFEMKPRLTQAHPHVDSAAGCVAIERGPMVYCIEQVDQEAPVFDLILDAKEVLSSQWRPKILGGVEVVHAAGFRCDAKTWEGRLYRPYVKEAGTPQAITAVPYFAWANREPGAMRVWIPL